MSYLEAGDVEWPGWLLHQAAIFNNVDLMKSLLEGPERQNINCQDDCGRTPLYTAVTKNSIQCCRLLLDAGANVDLACALQVGGMTPLHAAATDNKWQIVELLIEFNADLNARDASAARPVDLAEKNRNTECIEVIRAKHEREQHLKDKLQQNFIEACLNFDVENACRISMNPSFTLQDIIMLINSFRVDHMDLLYRTCDQGNDRMCEFLLQNGASVLINPTTGQNAVHVSCLLGHLKCAKLILTQYPDLINIQTSDGGLPIHMACILGQLDIVRVLLRHSTRNLFDLSSQTSHMIESVDHMINARDTIGRTPLHIAVINNHVPLVQFLLEGRLLDEDAELDSFEMMDTGVLEVEKNLENSSVGCFLVRIDDEDADGRTALHLAVLGDGKSSYHDVVSLLLLHKADPNRPIMAMNGESLILMEAVQRSDLALIDLLLKFGAKDENHKVLKTAIMLQDDESIGCMLQYQTYVDSEFKLHHKTLWEHLRMEYINIESLSNLVDFSTSYAVMICWHGLSLQRISTSWIHTACLHHLRQFPTCFDRILSNVRLCSFVITRLDISNNCLVLLPSFLFSLSNLRILNVSCNQIRAISNHSADAKKSTSDRDTTASAGLSSKCLPIEFQSADFNDDEIIMNCPFLEDINLQRNQISVLPASVFKLPSLKRLNAADNKISNLPFEMWLSTSLLELNLSINLLESLPFLPDVSSNGNQVESHPNAYAAAFRNTATLQDSCRELHPTELHNLSDSLMSKEPVEVNEGYNLLEINYVSCWRDRVEVETFSDNSNSKIKLVNNESHLKELYLSTNQLEELPRGLPCLAPRLEKLTISNNKLTQIGSADMYPSSLRSLDLSHNSITCENKYIKTFPIMIDGRGTPTGMTFNHICYSPFQSNCDVLFTSSLGRIRHSSSSLMSSPTSSSFTSVSPHPKSCSHRQHHRLDRLKMLKLNNNRLTKLQITVDANEYNFMTTNSSSRLNSNGEGSPRAFNDYPLPRTPQSNKTLPSALRRLSGKTEKMETKENELLFPNLILLDLSFNEIDALPSEICELSQLAELKISFNKIKELLPEMGLMKKLWYLDFNGCPVEATLQSILGEKSSRTVNVLSYLKSVREEAKPFNRMKLMLVGKQSIGKTSLLNQLRIHSGDRNKFSHWTQRMGHETKDKDLKGENISTVGVDIGTFEIQKGNDKISFSTWDFGGQREYYATHQYFLSKRSLYLVIWKVTDGEQGVNEILRWLINIQARAPNSPVIIVGTHRDLVRKNNFPRTYLEDLGELIERKYSLVTDPDKLGLPRVLSHVEVSCKGSLISRTYITQLVDTIWKVANEEQQPGNSGCRLLDQMVPSSYLHLQDVVVKLAQERKREQKDPVLYGAQYKHLVIGKMEELFNCSFQDISELNQATQFLHENGILLHYDDINLRDVYFLDPQWLCDMLASVITIREINGLIRSGVMKSDDLKLLFKGISFKSPDIKSYVVNLLQKFEVALLWSEESLVIPSLLPSDKDLMMNIYGRKDVTIPLQDSKKRCPEIEKKCTTNQNMEHSNPSDNDLIVKKTAVSSVEQTHLSLSSKEELVNSVSLVTGITASVSAPLLSSLAAEETNIVITNMANPAISVLRLYAMSYFPSGFWPRLITRLLGDQCFYEMVMSLYNFSSCRSSVSRVLAKANMSPCWKCWQTGLQLKMFDITILQIKEVSEFSRGFFDYDYYNMLMKQEQDVHWNKVDISGMSILEILIPNDALNIQILSPSDPKNFVLYPSSRAVASFLAKAVDCVDLLLEDWYPDIGIRFTQNTRGTYLITRLVPCTRCFLQRNDVIMNTLENDVWSIVDVKGKDGLAEITETVKHGTKPISEYHGIGRITTDQTNLVPSSSLSASERISRTKSNIQLQRGLFPEHLRGNTRSYSCDRIAKKSTNEMASVVSNGGAQFYTEANDVNLCQDVYCYTVEQCLQVAQLNRIVFCPVHGNLGPFFVASYSGLVYLGHVAPDTVFQDIGEDLLIDRDSLSLQKFLGKGAFGAVYAGTFLHKRTCELIPVATKMLQPIKPPPDATFSQHQLYQFEKSRWEKDPLKNCCEAYLNARKELSILLNLKHDHIVPLVGVSISPLCLVLSLAPLGALNDWLKDYLRAAARLPVYVVCQIIIQVGSALQYLHSLQIIYRDLKSENILVWSLPPPHSSQFPVNVKLADYGVSRMVLPFGTKGFAGTLAFMAPEIIQHGGDETYTEKVDCFSFGMFMYELLRLRSPYDETANHKGSNVNIKGHVLAGGRPMITKKEMNLPSNFLDLMTLCWSSDPVDRPSASEIVTFSSQIEFYSLCNAVMLEEEMQVICSCSASRPALTGQEFDEQSTNFTNSLEKQLTDVWLSVCGLGSSAGSLLVYTYQDQECIQFKKLIFEMEESMITCMCVTDSDIWCASSNAKIHIFRRSDYSHVATFSASSSLPSTDIACMTYGVVEDKVYIAMDNGQFIVYNITKDNDYMPASMVYPGNGELVYSIVAIENCKRCEVWCGQSEGRIQVWCFQKGAICVETLVSKCSTYVRKKRGNIVHVVVGFSNSDILWSYECPGRIDCWNVKTRSLISKVNVMDQLSTLNQQTETFVQSVISMNVIGDFLYVGMFSGYIKIVSTKTLNIVAILHAHEEPPTAILPLSFSKTTLNDTAPASCSHFIMSIGKGYKDLVRRVIQRYSKEQQNLCGRTFFITWTGADWSKNMATGGKIIDKQ